MGTSNKITVDRKLLEHVADVARLKLTEEEIKKGVDSQLNKAIEVAKKL